MKKNNFAPLKRGILLTIVAFQIFSSCLIFEARASEDNQEKLELGASALNTAVKNEEDPNEVSQNADATTSLDVSSSPPTTSPSLSKSVGFSFDSSSFSSTFSSATGFSSFTSSSSNFSFDSSSFSSTFSSSTGFSSFASSSSDFSFGNCGTSSYSFTGFDSAGNTKSIGSSNSSFTPTSFTSLPPFTGFTFSTNAGSMSFYFGELASAQPTTSLSVVEATTECDIADNTIIPSWSSIPNESKIYILTFLSDSKYLINAKIATESRKFLTYRLASKEFNTLLQSIPCFLTLCYIGTSPEQLDDLKDLFKFKINGLVLNNFNDNQLIFDHIRTHLSNLKVLDLCASPNLSINMFYYISKLFNLEILRLENSQINDQVLKYLKELTKIRKIVLRNSNISSKLFEELKENKYLNYIDLSHQMLRGSFPSQNMMHISNFLPLTYLNLSGQAISNDSLQYFLNLKNLTMLLLANTNIIDQGLDYIGKLSLTGLNLSSTRTTISGFQQRVNRGLFSGLQVLFLDQIPTHNINLSSLLMPLKNLSKIYLRNSGLQIDQIFQYYESVSGIKQQDVMEYRVVILPKDQDKTANGFFKNIKDIQNQKDVLIQEIPISPESLKEFYEQRVTGVKIYI